MGSDKELDERWLGVAEPEGRVGTLHRILKLHNRLLQPFSTHLSHRHNISLNEFRLLMAIGRLGYAASHELADHTGVNAMSVSRAVSTLQRHGRISVQTDPKNRRRKVLRLTDEGNRIYNIMVPQTEGVADYLLRGMSEDDIVMLDAIVTRMIARLEATDEAGNSRFIEETKPQE